MSFSNDVKQYFQTQDELRQIDADVKEQRAPLKQRLESLKESVIEFMTTKDIDQCNYHDERLELHKVTKTGSLTKKTLKEALDKILGDDSARVFDQIFEEIGTKNIVVLKRVKPRKRSAPVVRRPKRVKVDDSSDDSDDDDSSVGTEEQPPRISEDD